MERFIPESLSITASPATESWKHVGKLGAKSASEKIYESEVQIFEKDYRNERWI